MEIPHNTTAPSSTTRSSSHISNNEEMNVHYVVPRPETQGTTEELSVYISTPNGLKKLERKHSDRWVIVDHDGWKKIPSENQKVNTSFSFYFDTTLLLIKRHTVVPIYQSNLRIKKKGTLDWDQAVLTFLNFYPKSKKDESTK